jgi:hypothetical protein
MNRSVQIIAASVLLCVLGAACTQPAVETNTPQPTRQPSSTPTTLSTPTLTFTTRPTSTASFTPTPTATPPTLTPTATPTPGRQILIQYGWFGGDGGGPELFYLGSSMPEFVLYVDGQLLVQEGGFTGGISYSRAELSTTEMCGLLNTIKETGFFELEDDGRDWSTISVLYTFHGGDWPVFGEGSTNPIIQVNGDPAQDIAIINDWLDYLIPEVKDVYTLLDSYRHPGLELYVPDRVSLLVMRGPNWRTEEAGLESQPWPDDLPPLAELDVQADQALEQGEMRQVLLEGELAAEVYRLMGSRIIERPFTEDGEVYYLTARLLLPHETVDNISPQPYVNRAEFPLPFDCDE